MKRVVGPICSSSITIDSDMGWVQNTYKELIGHFQGSKGQGSKGQKVKGQKVIGQACWRYNNVIHGAITCLCLQIFPLNIQFPHSTIIHNHAKKLYLHMFDRADTAVSYKRELIVCSFLQDFFKGKGSSLHLICNAYTAFLLCEAELICCTSTTLCQVMWNSPNHFHRQIFLNLSKGSRLSRCICRWYQLAPVPT